MGKRTRIFRGAKDKDHPFKAVNRATFDGSGLSFEARGVMAYVLMKPDDWELNVPDLMREGGIGRDKAYRIIDECIEAGYMERVDGRDKRGKFGSNDIHVHELPLPKQGEEITPEPCTEKPDAVQPDTGLPDTDNPNTEKPYPENQEQTNKGIQLSSELTKKGGERAQAPRPPAKAPSVDDDVEFESGKPVTELQTMYVAVCEAVGWDYHVIDEADQVAAAKLVRDLSKVSYTTDDIRRFMVEVWFKDWRWEKRQERPKLGDIRQGIGALRTALPEHVPRVHTNGTSKVAGSMAAIDEYDRIKAKHGASK